MDTYPGASSFLDRHGKRRWRFRRKGKTIALPGQPGDNEFHAAYEAAIAGVARPKPQVRRLPGACLPKSLGAAWRLVQQSPEWLQLDAATRQKNIWLSELFLSSRVIAGDPTTWREIPVDQLKRRHLKLVLADHAATPHKAKHMLTAIRRMILAALDEEWIEADPSQSLKWRPSYKGWKAWPVEYLKLYQARWPIGTKQRLIYSLAFWLGNRVSDVAALRWDARCTRMLAVQGELREVDGFLIAQAKNANRRAKTIFVPIAPALAEVLAATARVPGCATVVVTAQGKPHSKKSLTNDMASYTAAAGIPPGYSLHGLRKTMGTFLAEGGASTRQLMEVLGHHDIEHAELYSRAADQALLAAEGMEKVIPLHRRLVG